MSSATIKVDDRVTAELARYHDGVPVAGWPNSVYVGTVVALEELSGIQYARVRYADARSRWRRTVFVKLDNLTVI